MTFKMTKKQQRQFAELLQKQAAKKGTTVEEVKASVGIDTLHSNEDMAYEAMSVLNFYKYRVQPLMEKKESEVQFDARFREWRFKTCEGCHEEFAYAFHYEGVKYCSLDCLEKALAEIGIKFSRHRSLDRRWGLTAHPAIVPSSALKVLKERYQSSSPSAFDSENSVRPKSRVHHDQHSNNLNVQDNQSSIA